MRKLRLPKVGLFGLGAVILTAFHGYAFAADAEAGKTAFATKCGICHQVGPDAKTMVGPALNGIVGGKAASVEGFAYSPGMKKLGEEGFVWNETHLDGWIADPKGMLPDSPMSLAFQGISDEAERANIIAYLKTQK
jgi:cytochrome c